MTDIRGSYNYVWSVRDAVGQGATGTVFRCRHKNSGDLYAAKVFNSHADRRPREVKDREIEVLGKLEHLNIVKLIALEQENGTKATVLLMELCECSLHDILEQPEHTYGLNEQDFKNVIRDVSAGMKYLCDNNIVHRDVKPGNILRADRNWGKNQYNERGRYVYKITDFGAARELKELDQPFFSTYGTEEYLHPDIYEKAVLKVVTNKKFSAAIDLWSLGVTFYHLATGDLPFKPNGGRKNKDMMFKMITEKNQGDIACYEDYKGQLIYSSKLPDSTCISQGLKNLITPILKGLLETNPEYMITHDRFFKGIEDIILMKTIHVYSTKASSMHIIYLKHSDNFSNLQDSLASQIGVMATEQELYYNGREFKPDLMAPILHYPDILADNPLILVTSEFLTHHNMPEKAGVASLPPLFPNRGTTEDNANCAKVYANLACRSHRNAEDMLSICKAIYLTHESVEIVLETALEHIKDSSHHIRIQATEKYQHLLSCKNIFDSLKRAGTGESCDKQKYFLESFSPHKEQYDKIIEDLSELEHAISDIVKGKSLKELWTSESGFLKVLPWSECIEYYKKSILQTYQRFDKAKYRRKGATILDDLIDRNERRELSQCYDGIQDQIKFLTKHRNSLHDILGRWLNEMRGKKEGIDKLREGLMERYEDYQIRVQNEKQEFERFIKELDQTSTQSFYFDMLDEELNKLEDLVQLAHVQETQLKELEWIYNTDHINVDSANNSAT